MRGRQAEVVAARDGDRLLLLGRLPSRFDRLVIHGPRRAQRRLGRGDRCLRRGALRERPSRSLPHLVRGERGELVDRAARVAQCGRADREREVAEDREAVQRAVENRSVEQREHAGGRDEQLVSHGVVAPRTAQAERVPGVDDLQLVLGIAMTLGVGFAPVGSWPLSMMQPAKNTAACVIPLQYAHRPETTTPPSTGRAFPRGAQTPAAIRCGSSNSSARLSAGRYAASKLLVAAIDTHQPAEASPRAISSAHRSATPGASSRPPTSRGAPASISPEARRRDELIGKAPLALRLRRQLAGQRGDLTRRALDLVIDGLSGVELSVVHGVLA